MLICGKNVIKEYMNTNLDIKEIYIQDSFNDKIIGSLEKYPIKTLKKHELDKMTNENHQGIIAKVEDFKYANLEDVIYDNSFVVILDHIEDPHNLGAIIRTCEAAGVSGVIIPKNRSAEVNSTVIKTSAGTAFLIPIVQVTNLSNTIEILKKNSFWVYGADMDGDDYSKLKYDGNICLVIGSEGSGMSRLVKEKCDFLVTIPMNGKVNSLNASVASGILIFEMIKKG